MTVCTVQSCFALNESPTLSSCATSSSSKHCRSMVTILWECTRRIASLGHKSGKEMRMKPWNVWKLDYNKMIINPGAVENSRSVASSACSPANPHDMFPAYCIITSTTTATKINSTLVFVLVTDSVPLSAFSQTKMQLSRRDKIKTTHASLNPWSSLQCSRDRQIIRSRFAQMVPVFVAEVRKLMLELVTYRVWKKASKCGAYRPFLPTNVARYPWPCVSSTVSVISRSWNMDSMPATVESESTEDKQRGKESRGKDSARFSKHAGLSEKLYFLQSLCVTLELLLYMLD